MPRCRVGGITLNVNWIAHLPRPLRTTAYFALQRLIGSRISNAWSDFQRWTRYTSSELEIAVAERLNNTLENALNESEYYRTLDLKRADGESAQGFLSRFPILTRGMLQDQFTNITVDRLRSDVTSPSSTSRKRYDWLVVKTGGTTGMPTSVIHDARFRDYGRATRLFSQQLCGFPLGTRYVRLWGSEQDLRQSAEKLDRRVLQNLLGEFPLNAFRAKELDLRQHLTAMNANSDSRHLMAYVDSAAILAMFIDEQKLEAPKFDTIMACAGTVTSEWRSLLERVFNAELFDKYGSRECADIACECTEKDGLHIYSPNVFIEIVNESGTACLAGETGRVLVTLLNNQSFPMIRYEIGDLATVSDGSTPCPCGLSFPKLESVQGRTDDMLNTESGTKLSSVVVRHFVGVSFNRGLIQLWQLEQIGKSEFTFRYVPSPSATHPADLEENLCEIERAFHAVLGKSCRFNFNRCSEIPPSASGKTRWIINSYNSEV